MIHAAMFQTVTVTLPYSEVCMSMHVAGDRRMVHVLPNGAQLLNEDGTRYSFPITHGEAGIVVTPVVSLRHAARHMSYSADEPTRGDARTVTLWRHTPNGIRPDQEIVTRVWAGDPDFDNACRALWPLASEING